MKFFFRVIFDFCLIFVIFFIHVAIVNFLPYPFSHFHFVIIAPLWLIFNEQSGRAITMALGTGVLMELLSSTFFGLQLLPLTITVLCMVKIAQKFLTTYSLLTVFFAGTLVLIIYRVLFLIFVSFSNLALRQSLPPYSKLLVGYGVEIGMSVALFSVIYLIQALISKRFNPRYVGGRY